MPQNQTSLVDFYDNVDKPAAPGTAPAAPKPSDLVDFYDKVDGPPPPPAQQPGPPAAPAAPQQPGILDRVKSAAASYLNPPPPPAPLPPPPDPASQIAKQNGNLDLPAAKPPGFARATQPRPVPTPTPEEAGRAQMTHAPGQAIPEPPPDVGKLLESAQEPLSKKLFGMSLSDMVDAAFKEPETKPQEAPLAGRFAGTTRPPASPIVREGAKFAAKTAAGIGDFAQSPEGIAATVLEIATGGGAGPVLGPLMIGQFEGQGAKGLQVAARDAHQNGFNADNVEGIIGNLGMMIAPFAGLAVAHQMHMNAAELARNQAFLDSANEALAAHYKQKALRENQAISDRLKAKELPNQATRRGTLAVPETGAPEEAAPQPAAPPEKGLYGIPAVQTNQPIVNADMEALERQTKPGHTAAPFARAEDQERGSSDIGLNKDGVEDAQKLAETLKTSAPFTKVLASDLPRAQQTADILNKTVGDKVPKAQSAPQFGAWSNGQEGKSVEDAKAAIADLVKNPDKVPEANPLATKAPESANQYSQRVIQALQQLLEEQKNNPNSRTAVITHATVEKPIDAWIKAGMPEDGTFDLNELLRPDDEKTGSISKIGYDGLEPVGENDQGNGLRFIRHGDTPFNADSGGEALKEAEPVAKEPTEYTGPERRASAPAAYAGPERRELPSITDQLARNHLGLASKPDKALSKRVADYYDQATSSPDDPQVKKAYDAFNKETKQQFEDLKKQGYTFTFTDDPKSYPTSKELIDDVKNNKHLTVWTGSPPEHGLITQEQNNMFRAVHDIQGHGLPEASFGHEGEEQAYGAHYPMYSEEAQPALATETRAQNAALHFSDKLKNDPSKMYEDKTEQGFNFPEQKAVAMPHELRKVKPEESEGLGLAGKEEETSQVAKSSAPAFEARTSPRGTTVWMSPEGLDLLKKAGVDKDAQAAALPPDHVRMLQERLANDKSKAAIELRAAIKQANTDQGRFKPIAFVQRPTGNPLALANRAELKQITTSWRHEHDHVQMLSENGFDAAKFLKSFEQGTPIHDLASRALQTLIDKNYPIEHAPWELIAHVTAGQHQFLGITPEENLQLFQHITDNIEQQVGPDKTLGIFEHASPQLQEIVNGIRKRTTVEGVEEPRDVLRNQEAGRAGSREEVALERSAKTGGQPAEAGGAAGDEVGLASKNIGKRELEQVGATERVVKPAEELADKLEKEGVKQNVIAAAERGSVAKYWYENSKKAFDKYFGEDAPMMTKLTAALSTAQNPKQNLITAVETYNKWKDAGRPTSEAEIKPILDSVTRIGGEEYPARYNNALTVLKGADDIDSVDLSGMKVRSFWRNLAGKYEFATLDRHMATLAGADQSLFGSASGYLGSQKIWKDAAAELGWKPAEVQAASWTFTKPFSDMVQKGIPAEEALKSVKELDKADVKDFAHLINNDPEVRELLDEHFKQQGTSLDKFEAEHGQAAVKYGRKERATTPFTEEFPAQAEAKIKADQAAKKAQRAAKKTRDAEKAGQQSLGFASKEAPPKDAGDALLSQPYAKQTRAANLNHSGFITEDGRTIQLDDSTPHAPALADAGLLADAGDYSGLQDALAKNKLVRVHVVKGFSPEVNVEMQEPPTRLQMSSLRNIAAANPRATFAYDLFRKDPLDDSGKRIRYQAGGNKSFTEFSRAANQVYQLGLSPRDMASKGEEGVLRFGGKGKWHVAPEFSTNSPEYQKLQDAQQKSMGPPSPTDLLASLRGKGRDAARSFLDRWVDVKKDVVEDAEKRGVKIPAGQNPLHALQLEYGGGLGRSEAAHWDMSDVKQEAQKAGLYGETTKYLNYVGNRRAIQVVEEKMAAATARGDTALAKQYADDLAEAKVAAMGLDRPKITAQLADMEKQLGPDRWKKIQGFADDFYKIPREALDMAHDEGIVSDDNYNTFTARGPEYVHMGRIIDAVDEGRGKFATAMSLREQHGVKALTGSELANKDPWATTMDNVALMYREIARNRAAKSLVEFRQIDPQGWGKLVHELKGTQTAGKGEGTVAYYEDGKPRTFAVPEPIADAVTNANSAEVKMLGQAMLGGAAKVFRAGATGLNAAYALTSPIREFIDTGTMTWKSPADAVKFTKNLTESLYHIAKKDDVYREFLKSGAAYATLQSRIDPYVNLHGNEGVLQKLLHPLQSVGEANNALQTMSKMAARQMFIDRGMDPTAAAAEARIYAGRPDVANAGTRTAEMNKMLMFFVDKLKGAERSYMFMKSHPKQFIVASGALALADLALNRYNSQFASPENDGTPEIDHTSDNDRRANYIILTPWSYQTAKGDTRLFSFKIPRGRFAAGGVSRDIMDGVFGNIQPKQTALNLLTDVMPGDYRIKSGDNALTDIGRMTAQTANPLIREPIEQYANQDMYSGKPIVTAGEQEQEPWRQYNPSTSPTAVALGRKLDMSPVRIEHALRGAGAGVADMIVSGIDALARKRDARGPAEGPEKASRLPIIGPIIRRFVGSPTDQVQVNDEQDFYDMLAKSQVATQTLDKGIESAQDRQTVAKEYMDQPEKIVLADAAPTLTEYSKNFAAMREMMNNVSRAKTWNDLDQGGSKTPVTDDEKKKMIKAIHGSYKELLNETRLVKKAVEAGKDLSEEDKSKMIADILNRNRNLNPQPAEDDDEQ